jgi:hypothetical protein
MAVKSGFRQLQIEIDEIFRNFCDDCAMRVGRPFAYKITSGYASSPFRNVDCI